MRLLLLVAVAVGCAKGGEPVAKPPVPPVPPAAAPRPIATPKTVDEAIEGFGDANSVFAFDINSLLQGHAGKLLPQVACAASLLDGVGQAVFAWGDSLEGYIWHVPEADAKACMPTLARVFGGHAEEVGDHIEIVAADRYALEWSGDTLHVSTVGAPVREKLSPALRALIKTVPAHQVFWVTGLMLMNKFPKTTFWGTVEGANLHVTVNTAGNEAQTKELFGVVNDTLREMAAKKQIHFEDSWVKITGQHLEVVMPAATLAALHQD